MKKINYIFLSTLFYTITISSQVYDPIIKEGSFWDQSKDVGFCGELYTRYTIVKDTLINTLIYKQLGTQNFIFHNDDPCFYYDTPPVVAQKINPIDRFIREDIDNRIVYIWSDKENNGVFKEFTLYDLSLSQGEKMINSYAEYGDDVIIDKIDYDSQGKKRFYLSNHENYYTEGIGSSGGIINFEAIIGEGNETLFCYGNAQDQNNCASVLANKYFKFSKTTIYPNPTTHTITLKNVPLNSRIRIVSLLGKLIDSFLLEANTINTSHFQRGVYFIEIITSNSAKEIIRIIKK